jgi:hypothetical protein
MGRLVDYVLATARHGDEHVFVRIGRAARAIWPITPRCTG